MNGMVSCKSCATPNSLDSAFCKKCGATLPADDVQQAKEKLESAVADGFKVFSGGRTAEAMQIAETAVLANPSSTSALSLKAMCHERLGQISEALECHERVLAIDPDSMIDKIKLNDLRNLLVARSSIASVPDRRIAIISAVAAFVLILSVGVVLARNHNTTPERVASNLPATSLQPKGSTFQPADTSTQTQTQPTGTGQPASGTTGGNPATGTGNGGDTQLPPLSNGHGSTLPVAKNSDEPPVTFRIDGPLPGTNPGPTTNPGLTNTTNTAQPPNGGDPPPTVDVTNPAPQPAQQGDPGIMEIQVVSGKPGTKGIGNDLSGHPNGVQALLRTASTQFQTRNYTGAATTYERALRAGANAGPGNQRLAECYEQLGRNADAVAAYNRAINALQSEIDAGKGDKTRLSTALDVCKQAVKVLGG